MAIIAEYQNPNGRKVSANPLRIRKIFKKGWYLTDIRLGNTQKSLQYYKNLKRDYPEPLEGWIFVGETTGYTDSGEYREDGSIVYTKESDGYNRIWEMSKLTGNEEECVILGNSILVLPSYNNTSDTVSPISYSYKFVDGDVFDPIKKQKLKTVATVHTHPNGTSPSTWVYDGYGDLGFAANATPHKAVYVFRLGRENVPKEKLGAVAFVISAPPLVLADNRVDYLHNFDSYEITRGDLDILHLLSGKESLRSYTLRYKINELRKK